MAASSHNHADFPSIDKRFDALRERAHALRLVFKELDQDAAGNHLGIFSKELHCNTLGAIVVGVRQRVLSMTAERHPQLLSGDIDDMGKETLLEIAHLRGKPETGLDGKPIHFESSYSHNPFTWITNLMDRLYTAEALSLSVNSTNEPSFLTAEAFKTLMQHAVDKELTSLSRVGDTTVTKEATWIKVAAQRIADAYVEGLDAKEYAEIIALPLQKGMKGTDASVLQREAICKALTRILDTVSRSIPKEHFKSHAQTH